MLPNIAGLVALVLCSLLVAQASATEPYPGMSCNWKSQCKFNQTRMSCHGYGTTPTCLCEKFMADSTYNVTTVPVYSSDLKMCIVKTGEPCLVEKPDTIVMQCESDAKCDTDLGPKTKSAGLCSAGPGSGSRIPSAMYFLATTVFAIAFTRL